MNTKEYIEKHIDNVGKKLRTFIYMLYLRGQNHDKSKLEEPEFSLWCKMDEEPRYPYNSKQYKDKMKRYKDLFEHHYSKNRHHPDKWSENLFPFCPDLIDLIEMLCDWIAYKENLSFVEAKKVVNEQSERFGFSEELSDILLNTLYNYYATIGGIPQKDFSENPKENNGKILNVFV